jgi:hypothetical protein
MPDTAIALRAVIRKVFYHQAALPGVRLPAPRIRQSLRPQSAAVGAQISSITSPHRVAVWASGVSYETNPRARFPGYCVALHVPPQTGKGPPVSIQLPVIVVALVSEPGPLIEKPLLLATAIGVGTTPGASKAAFS